MILGRALGGPGGLTLQQLLHQDGNEAVFLGIGLPDPKKNPLFNNLTSAHGFYTSKDFLPLVANASKPGLVGSNWDDDEMKLYIEDPGIM